MSSVVVVEFYDRSGSPPIGCAQAFHGGENPSMAATTLSDFFENVRRLPEPRMDDAGLLAARFVVWASGSRAMADELAFSDVAVIPYEKSYGYQVARVYPAEGSKPYVHMVVDEWTKDRELAEAAIILGQESVGPPAI